MKADSTGLAVDETDGTCRAGLSASVTKSKVATDKKSMTACFEDMNSAYGTGKYPGETTAYTQGMTSFNSVTKFGSKVELAVSVQFAAEEGATSLLTTLGAIALGAAAMAF